MFRTSKSCYCAFCRTPRRIYRKKHVSLIDFCLAGGASVLLSFICWQDVDPRLVMFFAFGLGFAEIFILVRWRMSIPCPHCGFDPVLYKKHPEQAAHRVKDFLDIRRDDPLAVFSPLNLPVLTRKVERKIAHTQAKAPLRTTAVSPINDSSPVPKSTPAKKSPAKSAPTSPPRNLDR